MFMPRNTNFTARGTVELKTETSEFRSDTTPLNPHRHCRYCASGRHIYATALTQGAQIDSQIEPRAATANTRGREQHVEQPSTASEPGHSTRPIPMHRRDVHSATNLYLVTVPSIPPKVLLPSPFLLPSKSSEAIDVVLHLRAQIEVAQHISLTELGTSSTASIRWTGAR